MGQSSDWKERRIGDVCVIQNGFAFDSGFFTDRSDDTPLIRIRDLKKGDSTDTHYSGPFDKSYLVRRGDFLVGMDGEFRCYEWQGPDALLNQRVCRLHKWKDDLAPHFVFFAINAHLSRIEADTSYSTVKHISSKQIAEIKIHFPPLAEQRRIVARIQSCMERVREMSQLHEEATRQSKAVFPSLVEDLMAEGDGKESSMADACDIEGVLVDPRETKYQKLKHVGGANIVAETGQLVDLKTAEEETLISGKFVFTSEDVLYSKIRPYLKKVVRPGFSGLCSADIYPLRPRKDHLNKDYLFFLLLSRNFTEYAIRVSNRAGMPKVNRNQLFAYRFKLPPLKVQERLVDKIDTAYQAALGLRDQLQEVGENMSHIQSSVLSKAFAGEL